MLYMIVERFRGGDAVAVRADVTSEADVRGLVAQTLDEFGRIDVLVNNAFKPYAFDPEARKMFWDLEWRDFQTQLDGALFSTYTLCQAVLPALKKRTRGSIVNMASDLVARPTIPYHDYTTAKAALQNMQARDNRLLEQFQRANR